jgi:ribosomal protein S18 acetylase RimI-like enzyme
MPLEIVEASPADADAIAALHAASWQSAYRGILPDAYLAGPVAADRRCAWHERMDARRPDQVVLIARREQALCGFACLFLDADERWGALLDNLHVSPANIGRGIGSLLLSAVRTRVQRERPGRSVHLFVLEANTRACRFYEQHGGRVVEHTTVEFLPGLHIPDVRYVFEPMDLSGRESAMSH